ncbi:MAG: phospholipase A [Muribaculaceae bacterium]|nr:phospholipase A [Muribaculaceae bacterium]
MNRIALINLLSSIIASFMAFNAHAQIISPDNKAMLRDSVIRDFDSRPSFGLYKDNYFIFGPAIGHKMTKENTNVKFQISISQKLTRSTLPFGTYLYLFYTQKVFWNILENSMPMTDLNFNPGIGLTKPLFQNNRYIGKLTLMLEHESNGRDSIQSRSWNKVSFGASIYVDPNLMVYGKVWIPIVDGVHNKDILRYSGLYQVGLEFLSNNRRFFGNVTLVKRAGKPFNYNTTVELGYRFAKRDNQYFFLQYYNGYGEGLLAYKQFHSQLRIGICIRPPLFSDY